MLTKSAALVGLKAGPDDNLDEGEFTGYASVFGNVDAYGDVVFKGAFVEDLDLWAASGNAIPLLFGHRMDDPDYNLGHIVEAEEDDKGLKVRGKLDLDNPKAAQTYRLLKGRRLSQMSFAYDILEAGWEVRETGNKLPNGHAETEEIFALRKLHVHEVSLVPIGANAETEILEVKSLQAIAARAEHGRKAGRAISAKNEAELRTAYDALGRVLSVLDESTDEDKASGKSGAAAVRAGEKSVPAETGTNPSVDASIAHIETQELEIELLDAPEGC